MAWQRKPTANYRTKSKRATITAPLARPMPTPRAVTPPARPNCEPLEPDHLSTANDALDELERLARAVIDAGGIEPLRRRLAPVLAG